MTGSPRKIALAVNDSSGFEDVDASYDSVAGVPSAVSSSGTERDYRANPTNPSEKPLPAKNLKR